MFGKYFSVLEIGYRQSVAYKGDFIIGSISTLFRMMILAYIWTAVYQNANTTVINGRGLIETITYIILAQLIWSVLNTNLEVLLGFKIKKGEITRDLIKPINFPLLIFLDNLGFSLFILLVQTMPAFVIACFMFDIQTPASILHILFTLLSIILAFFIYASFSFTIGIIGFWAQNVWGISLLKKLIFNTFSGSLVPLFLYPPMIQKWIYLLPFKEIINTPLVIYLDADLQMILSLLGRQLFWAVTFFILSQISWMYLKRKIEILGG